MNKKSALFWGVIGAVAGISVLVLAAALRGCL